MFAGLLPVLRPHAGEIQSINEDFYYIEVWLPPRKVFRYNVEGCWSPFGWGYKWSLNDCLAAAEKRKKQNPREKIRIVHQFTTITEWKDRKKLK